VDGYDRPEVDRLCRRLIEHLRHSPHPYPEDQARRVLRLLRRKRQFRLMAEAAEALIAAGGRTAGVACDHAQALIDLGMPAAALDVLDRLLRGSPGEAARAEAEGLVGRAYKQMYVAGGRRPELLRAATEAYAGAFARLGGDLATCGWHGINAAALACRAVRDGLVLDGLPDPVPIAARLLAEAESRRLSLEENAGPWDAALAAEAALVLARPDEARRWLERYVDDPRADEFELGSTLRQLVEVWQLDSVGEPGRRLLPLLRAGMLQRAEGARIELAAAEVVSEAAGEEGAGDEAGLEKVLGRTGMVSHTWYRRGLSRSRAVARIDHESGRPVGTGFLTDRRALTGSGDGQVLVTNSHVLAPDPQTDDTLSPGEAVVTLQALAEEGAAAPLRVAEVLWTSPPRRLDVTVAVLSGAVAVEPCPLTASRPRLDGRQRVYVIGHPEGRELSYAIDDNVLLDYDDRVLHYRAPTEHGSSGSPVFNRDWQVVAVHHAGRTDMPRLHGEGTYPANEGIWIEAVRREMGGP
jgi:hypothetical protein